MSDPTRDYNEWKKAVIDQCAITHMPFYEDDPRKTLDDIINWHVSVALDPQVSSDAQALADSGKAIPAGWQPIETAPKTGVEVLLYIGAPWSKVEKSRWYEPWKNWQAGVIPADPVREEYHGIGSALPTHWMPLPAAPKGEQL